MRNSILALLCVLSVASAVSPVKDFDVTQVNGKWYLLGFATNAEWFVKHKTGMKMGVTTMIPTEALDLQLAYVQKNADGSCWRMSHMANKTETPGHFTFHSEAWDNDNDMIFTDVEYAEYALVHNLKTKAGLSEVLIKLFSRSTQASPVTQQKFTQLSTEEGILPDNIVMLPNIGECAEA